MWQTILKTLQNSDHFLLYPVLWSMATVVIISVVFLFYYQNLPPQLPLFYSLPWGKSQLVTKQQFILLPAVLTLIVLTNTVLATNLHPLQSPLKRMLMVSLVMISLLVLYTALKILFIFI